MRRRIVWYNHQVRTHAWGTFCNLATYGNYLQLRSAEGLIDPYLSSCSDFSAPRGARCGGSPGQNG